MNYLIDGFNTSVFAGFISYLAALIFLPLLVLGTIAKSKAFLQNRCGPPLLQPFYDVIKLFRKSEIRSISMSWLFRSSSALNLANMIIISALLPWLSFKPAFEGDDLFLLVYLFALSRFFSILAALDSGSAFGAFAASREATLSMLVEPATILSLVSLAVLAHTSKLNLIFSFESSGALSHGSAIWILSGSAILLASLVELSRMPIDDPTTHLELTMVHEAMILESSGRNLAFTEYAHAIKMCLLFGLAFQCYLHALHSFWKLAALPLAAVSIAGILLIAVAVGIFEAISIKLQWRKNPEFIAYCLSMSLLASLIAIAWGIIK